MTNYYCNTIVVKRDKAQETLRLLVDDGEVDLNRLIPMPRELDIPDSVQADHTILLAGKKAYDDRRIASYENLNRVYYHRTGKSISSVQDISDMSGDPGLAKKYIENYKRFGFCTWLKWRLFNWGTSGNAMNTKIFRQEYYPFLEDDEIKLLYFETPDSPPDRILRALSQIIGFVKFYGTNEGKKCNEMAIYVNGEMIFYNRLFL